MASIEAGGSTSNHRMRKSLLSISLRSFFLAALAAAGALSWGAPHPEAESGALLATMQAELERAKDSLSKSDPAPYFISYEVYDQHTFQIAGTYGTIVTSNASNRRWADVTMRVGSPVLDNTHNENRSSGITSGPLPLADDRDAIARTLWEMTNREYRRASPAYCEGHQQYGGAGGGGRQVAGFFTRVAADTARSSRRSDRVQSKRVGRQDPEIFVRVPEISRRLHFVGDAANPAVHLVFRFE